MQTRAVVLASFLVGCGQSPPAAGAGEGSTGSESGASTSGSATSTTGVETSSSSGEADSSTGEPLEPYAPVDLFAAVDPFLGTGGSGFRAASVYPGPAMPFGMIHPGPDTSTSGFGLDAQHCSGYFYSDTDIDGFSLTRMSGTGVPDYGTMAIMPVDGMDETRRSDDGHRASFDKDGESAEPGYYRVRLDSGIDVEITTSHRASIFRFTFDGALDPVVVLDADHVIGGGSCESADVAIDLDARTIDARMLNQGDLSQRFGGFDVFAHAAFDVEPLEAGVWNDDGLMPDETEAAGVDAGAWFRFPEGTRTVTMRVGMSFVDAEGARGNLEAEIPDFDFDAVRTRAADAWQEALGRLEMFDLDEDRATMIATAWYRTLLMPTLVTDADGRTRGVDDVIRETGSRYSDFSLWDTYRTTHPWLMLVEHPLNARLVASLVQMGEEGGAVPRWALAKSDVRSMIGSPGEIVLAESALKGVDFDDEEAAFELALVTAQGPAPGAVGGRSAIEDYLALGYVPGDVSSSVSRTMEYAIADAALSRWAARLGRDAQAETLGERGHAAEGLYDPKVGFHRAKDRDGDFAPFEGETNHGGPYVEGTPWQYLWLEPHDPDALAELLGGPEAARERLQTYFDLSKEEIGGLGPRDYHWQGNQPDIHAPWLFAMWGDRPQAMRFIRWVVDKFYDVGPNGMPGNDDAGTMSAWLLFAASGLYPVAGSDLYMIAAPLQRRMDLHRDSGTLTILAEPDPRTNPIPARIFLDGEELTGTTVSHQALVGEHTLRFEMQE